MQGDKLWRVPTMRHGGSEREVTVTKVGRPTTRPKA